MRRFKRTLGLTGLTGLLAAVAAAAPAQAQVESSATAGCTVSGQATTSPGVEISGGSGGYTFTAAAGVSTALQLNCVVDIGAEAQAGATAVVTVDATSIGTYANTVCGTGSATSTSNAIDPADVNVRENTGPMTDGDVQNYIAAQDDDLDYSIDFIGTVGTLTFASDAGNASGSGPIQITDPTPDNTGTGEPEPGQTDPCTKDFQVTGALEGDVPAE